MANVSYKGTSDERIITKRDWESIGVEDQGKVVWSKENDFTADISENAAAWLKENDSDFQVGEATRDASSDDESGSPSGLPQVDPSSIENATSTRTRRSTT